MNMLDIGEKLYHPMSIDIIEHKVTEIRLQDGGLVIYKIESINDVGACGKVESLVTQTSDEYFTFIGLLTNSEYVDGLKDFIEGRYYKNRSQAKGEFYNIQRTIARSKVNELERRLRDAKKSYAAIEKIIKEAKKSTNN